MKETQKPERNLTVSSEPMASLSSNWGRTKKTREKIRDGLLHFLLVAICLLTMLMLLTICQRTGSVWIQYNLLLRRRTRRRWKCESLLAVHTARRSSPPRQLSLSPLSRPDVFMRCHERTAARSYSHMRSRSQEEKEQSRLDQRTYFRPGKCAANDYGPTARC